jgi:imidazolonepropionase
LDIWIIPENQAICLKFPRSGFRFAIIIAVSIIVSIMLIHSTSQLLTLAGGPQRGRDLGRLGIIPDGAILVRDGLIKVIGTSEELLRQYPDEPRFSANGMAVLPGFVDPHTHLVFAGDRAAEFEQRLEGKSYMEILAAGGGILSTVHSASGAGVEELLAQSRDRALRMLANGTTTTEAKTGYGLELNAELEQLEALLRLDESGPLQIVPTFLAAHAIPPDFTGGADGYTAHICLDMFPALKQWWLQRCPLHPLPFVDVFCERGAFDLDQSRRILTAAQALGFPLKIHADEFTNLGGAALAAGLGAASADHLVKTSNEDIRILAASTTAAVALPCTPFGLGEKEYTPARSILQAGGLLALASDLNPGTAWCESMQFVIALACRTMRLTPAEAVAAATINAAYAIALDAELGSLEVGKQADVIVLSVPDYRHLAYRFGGNLVRRVIKKGEVVV